VFDEKLNFLIGTLQALGSDVVALQEILDLDALQDLANGLGFQHFAGVPDSRGNRVSFLTREAPTSEPQKIDQWQLAQGVDVRDFDDQGNVTVVLSSTSLSDYKIMSMRWWNCVRIPLKSLI